MTTALLRQIEAQDQAELAEKHNTRGKPRGPVSHWVIDKMRHRLPPHHVGLANRLMDLAATAGGIKPSGLETVDGGGNGQEGAMRHRCDALRALHGYEAAIRSRLDQRGARCFWAIVHGASTPEVHEACGYARGSNAMVVKLVQLVLMAAQDYDDLINGRPLEFGEKPIDTTMQIAP